MNRKLKERENARQREIDEGDVSDPDDDGQALKGGTGLEGKISESEKQKQKTNKLIAKLYEHRTGTVLKVDQDDE